MIETEITYYREVLVMHARVADTNRCPVCGTAPCRDFIDAYDKLAAAGQLMLNPEDLPPGYPLDWRKRLGDVAD